MSYLSRKISGVASILAVAIALTPATRAAQNLATKSSDSNAASSKDRWLHVRVDNQQTKDETVRVNVPLDLAEKVLPTIDKDRLHHGKVTIDKFDCQGVDIHALMAAVREAKDGEFVTVQNKDNDVRVAKQNNYFVVHVTEKNHPKNSRVEVKVPMKVVDALLSAGKDELDLVAGLRALAANGDTELVSVKDEENSVRVWLDSKNSSD
jgi:hypothetical protein